MVPTIAELQQQFGSLKIGDKSLDLNALLDRFQGKTINVKAILPVLKEVAGEKASASDALGVLEQGVYFREIEWAREGGYTIGRRFTEVPVRFKGEHGSSTIISADEAEDFARQNPDWKMEEL